MDENNDSLMLLKLKMECGQLINATDGVVSDKAIQHILVPELAWNRFCEAVVNIENFDPLDEAMDELRTSAEKLLNTIDKWAGRGL